MIKIQGDIPRQVGVAVSGGVDSMAALDFLRRNHDVTAYCYDHATEHGRRALELVREYCQKHRILLRTEKNSMVDCPADKSWEEHWRDQRYGWLHRQAQEIVLAHHLDDCIESWVFNMCHGSAWTIPYRKRNCFRPFRLTDKRSLEDWARSHKVPWMEDPSNMEIKYKRNWIRQRVIPTLLDVNPGLAKVIKKKIADEDYAGTDAGI
jgi:tRNA(Ile)-lysidine synthase